MDTYEIINSYNVEKAFQEAKELYENSHFDKSISIFTNIINKYPNNIVIHNYLYCSYFNLKKYKESLFHIEKCLSDVSIEKTTSIKEHYCRIFLNLKLYNKARQLIVEYLNHDNNLIYHQLMCELGKLDNNSQYYHLYRKSAIILINNKFANIDVYVILLYIMTCQEKTLSKEILHLIHVILIYITDKQSEYQHLKELFINHTFDNLHYRESFFIVFKELDLLLSFTILIYHSFINNPTTLQENMSIIRKHSTYKFISDMINDLKDVLCNLFSNYIVTNDYIKILLEEFEKICPKIGYQSQYLSINDNDNSDNKPKIAFITYNWSDYKVNYQYKRLIQNINDELFETYIFGFTNEPDENIILLDPNLEKTQHILSECKLDIILYIDVTSNLEIMLLSNMKLSRNQFSIIQEVPHLNTLSLKHIDDINWLGGYYPEINTMLYECSLAETRLFPALSNVYLVFHYYKYYTNKYISMIINILESDSSGIVVVNLSPNCFSNLLEKIHIIDSQTLVASRIHNLPFNSFVESCRLISQCSFVLDIGDNNYDLLTLPSFIQSIHYGIPFLSLNNDIQIMLKRLKIHKLLVNNTDEYIYLIKQIYNDSNMKLELKKTIIDSKEYLFESDIQIDIFHTFLNNNLKSITNDFTELENMLFN
jgi:hypothetical protein